LVQDRPQLLADRRVHRLDPGFLARIGSHDMRLNHRLQQGVDGRRSHIGHRSCRRWLGCLAQQAFEQGGVVFRGGRFRLGGFLGRRGAQFGDGLGEAGRIEQAGAAATQGLKQLQPLVKRIGMKVVELGEADRQRRAAGPAVQRQPQLRRQPGHDRVEVVGVGRQQRPAAQLQQGGRVLPPRPSAEVGHDQHAQRSIGIAAVGPRSGTGQFELKFHSAWHGASSPER
jgi:hypothetical protein